MCLAMDIAEKTSWRGQCSVVSALQESEDGVQTLAKIVAYPERALLHLYQPRYTNHLLTTTLY